MNNKVLSLLLCVVGIVFSLLFSYIDNRTDLFVPQVSMLIVLVVLCCFLLYQQSSEFRSYWYKPSNIFLLGYIIVNFQYVVDLLVGFKSYSDFYIPFVVNRATYISVLGLLAFVVGYFLSNSRIKRTRARRSVVVNFKLIVFFQLLFFVGWCYTIDLKALVSGFSYFEYAGGSAQAFFENLFYGSTLAILAAEVSNAKVIKIDSFKSFIRHGSILSWLLITLYILLRLVSGDRGPALYTLLAIFFAYIMTRKRAFPTKRIIIPVLILAIALNIVGMARSMDLSKSFSERAVLAFTDYSHSSESRFSDRTIIPLTEELAISTRCNLIAIDLVDNLNHPFHYGHYLFYQIVQCVPFVPAFLSNKLQIKPDELSSNILMTDVYYGRHDFAQIGTTVIADSYLDFGIWGVLMMLFVIGYIYKKIDYGVCISLPSTWFLIIAVLLFASMSIYIPRSTFVFQIKQLIPTSVIYYMNKKLMSKKYAK